MIVLRNSSSSASLNLEHGAQTRLGVAAGFRCLSVVGRCKYEDDGEREEGSRGDEGSRGKAEDGQEIQSFFPGMVDSLL